MIVKEYRTISEVAGPLMLVRDVEEAAYDELGEIRLQNGEIRRCKVLEVNGTDVLVQLFESSAASLSAEWISSRLLNGAGCKGGVLMKIISKRQAMAIYRQHPQSRLFRFCTGKYKWSGSICHYAGREVDDISGVLAVFAERRQDRNGPYVVLRSVSLN